ncbi:unnamed protein product [Orchesella dallaii]
MPSTEEDVFETSGNHDVEDMEVEAQATATASSTLSTTASTNKDDDDALWAKLPKGAKEMCEGATGMLYMERYQTFLYNKWPYDIKLGNLCHPGELAMSGLSFYSLDPSPSAQCQVCLTVFNNLGPNSDPWSLHAETKPGCFLIQLGKRKEPDDYVLDEIMGMALIRILTESSKVVQERTDMLKRHLFELKNKELQRDKELNIVTQKKEP